jgi:DNA polymerase III subunit gamma/tau
MEFSELKSSQTQKMVFTSEFDLEGTAFTFKLANKVKFDIFYELRQDLLDFLRKKLENGTITAEAIIRAEQTKAKPRTEQEKFESMANKNPAIWKLKEALDLDLLFLYKHKKKHLRKGVFLFQTSL